MQINMAIGRDACNHIRYLHHPGCQSDPGRSVRTKSQPARWKKWTAGIMICRFEMLPGKRRAGACYTPQILSPHLEAKERREPQLAPCFVPDINHTPRVKGDTDNE